MNFPEFWTHRKFIRVEILDYLHKSSIFDEILMWMLISTQRGQIDTQVKTWGPISAKVDNSELFYSNPLLIDL